MDEEGDDGGNERANHDVELEEGAGGAANARGGDLRVVHGEGVAGNADTEARDEAACLCAGNGYRRL